jgi:hypothetical protein
MKRKLESIENEEKKRIDARSKESVEASEKFFIEVTTKGKKIMPMNARKYTGSLYQPRDTNVWITAFTGHPEIRSKTHKTKEDAECYKKSMNEKHNLSVANIIYEYKNQYYCVLTQNQLMKFSIENLDIVEKYTWCADLCKASGVYYARTTNSYDREKPEKLRFHRLLFPDLDDDKTVDHFNHDTLDNNKSNLRIATHRTQAINRRIFSNNASGVTGVSVYENGWRARWQNEKGFTDQKTFPSSKYKDPFNEAVVFLQNIKKEIDVYKIAACPIK